MLVCDLCGRPSPHFFLRNVGDRDVYSCLKCIDLGLQITELLAAEGCLNGMEVCRLLNGVWDPRECHRGQTFGAIRGWKCQSARLGCTIPYTRVLNTLWRLYRKGRVQSVKRRFWDKQTAPTNTDLFRFWFINREAYEKRILAQTLEGYF